MERKVRLGTALFALFTSAVILTACSGMTWNLSVGGCIGGNCQPAKGQTKSMQASDVSSFDARLYDMTYTVTGGITSDPGVFRIDLISAGTLIASSYFGYTRSGNDFTATDPASISNWVHGYVGQIDEIDVELDGVKVAEVDGSNTVAVNTYYNGSSVGTASATWTASVNHQNF
jgi:hypothetical protein